MVRRLLVLSALCGCTQSFDSFNPADDAAVVDVSTDGPGVPETGADASVDAPKADVVAQDVTTKDVTPDIGPADVTPDAPVACTETGAVQYGGHCYFLMASTQDFNTAKANCQQANNAHLVTITTAGEQTAVAALGTGERWIGLYRSSGAAKDQFYAWITGEGRNGYADWSPGEPNGTGQCGTLLGTGLWNDEDCSISLASICERE